MILDDCCPILLPEAMRVHSALIGATELDIDKLVRRVPALNLALPGEGDPKEMQAVIDACPFASEIV